MMPSSLMKDTPIANFQVQSQQTMNRRPVLVLEILQQDPKRSRSNQKYSFTIVT